MELEKEGFLENVHVLSCFVLLKSILLILCVLDLTFCVCVCVCLKKKSFSECWQSTVSDFIFFKTAK